MTLDEIERFAEVGYKTIKPIRRSSTNCVLAAAFLGKFGERKKHLQTFAETLQISYFLVIGIIEGFDNSIKCKRGRRDYESGYNFGVKMGEKFFSREVTNDVY